MTLLMKVLLGALAAAPWAAALETSFGSGGRTVQSIQRRVSVDGKPVRKKRWRLTAHEVLFVTSKARRRPEHLVPGA